MLHRSGKTLTDDEVRTRVKVGIPVNVQFSTGKDRIKLRRNRRRLTRLWNSGSLRAIGPKLGGLAHWALFAHSPSRKP